MELHEIARQVNSKETFLEFIAALRADWEASRGEEKTQPSSPYGPDARGWENPDLGRVLEALHSWTDDMGNRVAEEPTWQTFANMLMAAKIYE